MASEIKKVEKEIVKEEKKVVSSLSKLFKNYWAVATVVLAILLLVVLIFNATSGISKNEAGKKILDFAAKQGINATVLNVTSQGSLYQVVLQIQGQEVPVYITKDGKNLVAQPIPLTETTQAPASNSNTNTQAANVPKTDKPVVDLYVFAYCPYGTQTEKGFVPVYNILKNQADLNIVYIGAMHGEFEKVESLRQLCVLKNYGKDKLFSYIDAFNGNAAVGSCSGKDTCVNPLIETIFTQLSINKNTINTCMTNDAPALYAANTQKAQANGVSGSPTLIINGVQAQTGRSPAALLSTICSAFTNKPVECNQQLSTATPSAGFGSSTGAATGASCN